MGYSYGGVFFIFFEYDYISKKYLKIYVPYLAYAIH